MTFIRGLSLFVGFFLWEDFKMKKKTLYPNKYALVGDVIQFERNDTLFIGTVVSLRENSVIVELTTNDAVKLELENERTVVSHKKYKLKERCSNPPSPTFSYFESMWTATK